jgi:hypothetical protein
MARNNINLTIDTTNSRVQIDFLKTDDTTVSGTKYITSPWARMDADGDGWVFDRYDEVSFNGEIFFSQIIKLNGAPIGTTTYAQVTTLLLALQAGISAQGKPAASQAETPAMSVLSASGSVASGKKSVTIITDSDFVGTILGTAAVGDMTYTFTASSGNTLTAIPIVITSGTCTVITLS